MTAGDEVSSVTRRLGVIGTLVWDTIFDRHHSGPPKQRWGGIAYALGAFEATMDPRWEMVPFLKVGSDLAGEAREFLAGLPRAREEAVRVVEEPNNRVELRYVDDADRTERLTGGVPGWTPPELEPLLNGVDALYVNFISGFEMDLATARWIRERFDGPIYADLHSLFLGVTLRGERFDQQLANSTDWLQSFNAVQLNETEFGLLGGDMDSWRLVERALGDPLKLVAVTRGPRGADYVAVGGLRVDPMTWSGACLNPSNAPSSRGHVASDPETVGKDPTGCGDVWGATTFARLLSGDPLVEAMRVANRTAALNARFIGATTLYDDLIAATDRGAH